MVKVIVAGGRDFNDYNRLRKVLDSLFSIDYIQIVSGGARGADRLGERYAIERYIGVKRFPADWDKYGYSAGPRRNKQMADYGDYLVAFWDGKSKGTRNMIDQAIKRNLKIVVIRY